MRILLASPIRRSHSRCPASPSASSSRNAHEFEINFRRTLIEHFGSEDSTTFTKWAHDYALEQCRSYPTGIDEADQLIGTWREAEARAHCLALEEWMRCVPEPVFEVGLEH